MSNKILLEDDNHGGLSYEPSDSEDDYSEEEKELLQQVRKGNRKKVAKKQELMAFDDDSDMDDDGDDDDDDDDEDDIMAESDIEGADHGYDIPDAKAWGKQRRSYYNTDFVDQDYNSYNQREEEEALQEEEEAKAIQKRLAQQLDEADFFLDTQQTDQTETNELDEKNINFDLNDLSEREKLKLFHKDSPEYAGLVADFQTYLNESEQLLCPFLKFVRSQGAKMPIVDFVETRNNMCLSYCLNIAFYLYLKTKKIPIKYHPVTKRLAQFRKLFIQIEERYANIVRPQIEQLLQRIESGEDVKLETQTAEATASTKQSLNILNPFRSDHKNDDGDDDDDLSDKQTSDNADDSSDENDEENPSGDEETDMTNDRRSITYQISKNKGLTPHRKKENRNPRVKHRRKFRKAMIRRKGAVRTIRKETQRYTGEISGIKATVVKGIKLNS